MAAGSARARKSLTGALNVGSEYRRAGRCLRSHAEMKRLHRLIYSAQIGIHGHGGAASDARPETPRR